MVRSNVAHFAAHLFGLLTIILLLVWLLHFRGGIDITSDNSDRVINAHPFLMFFGFIWMAGQAMMAYRTIGAEKKVQKLIHMALHLIAMILGIVGIYAAFKFHDQNQIPDMYSLHSWLGMGTFCLFGLQFLFGFATFLLPRTPLHTRERLLPWHVYGGRTLLFMAVLTAETGLMMKATSMQLQHGNESRLMNFIGIFILFFGISVDVSLSLLRIP